ncbi:MAG: M20 family metallopeptidase [Candidatus Nitrosocaldus sp.]
MLGSINDAVDREMPSIVDDALELIRMPSRNPPGEERCAEYIYLRLKELGMHTMLLYEPFKDRPQVIAYPSNIRAEDAIILLNGHIDTVPEGSIEEWSVDPFSGIVKDGYIYGRGSSDMKSALAVMMHICKIVEDARVILSFAIGEERAEPGTSTMLKHLYGMGIDRIKHGIVMEPTSLRIAACQMGALWFRVTIKGKAAHASIPTAGTNAIVRACKVVDALGSYVMSIEARKGSYDGYATNNSICSCIPRCSVTMIEGGVKENVIPDECSLTIDRRIAPYEDRSDVIGEIKALLDLHAGDYRMEVIAERSPVRIDESSMLVSRLSSILASIGINSNPSSWCFPGSTDNEYIVREGIESIVWGPGSIEQAHAVDEHISIDEIKVCTYALASLLHTLYHD